MKRVILVLSLVFSLFMSMAAFAGEYTIGDPYWDIGDKVYVGWDEAEDKTQYKLQVFKGNKKVSSNITTSSARYDVTKIVIDHGSGTYTFKVYPSKGGKDLQVEATTNDIDSETLTNLKKKNNTASNNTTSGNTSTTGSTSTSGSTNTTNSTGVTGSSGGPGVAASTGWYQTSTGWHYKKADGYNSTGWEFINNKWYYFDSNANMQTGWVDYNGSKYYLKPNDGDMATSWELIGGKWYLFDESGHPVKGWFQYNNAWYYITDSGEMAVSTSVDGYNINQDGIWVQ